MVTAVVLELGRAEGSKLVVGDFDNGTDLGASLLLSEIQYGDQGG